MARYRTKGTDLFDGNGDRVATVRGSTIYDAGDNKVAILNHPEVYDIRGNRVAVLRGADIYDARNRKIATISDIDKDIESLLCGAALVGLWLFFVRNQPSKNQPASVAQQPPKKLWDLLRKMPGFQDSKQMKS